MKNLTFIIPTLKQGSLLGLGFCLYTTVLWLTKLDSTYLNYGQYINIILLPIVMISFGYKTGK